MQIASNLLVVAARPAISLPSRSQNSQTVVRSEQATASPNYRRVEPAYRFPMQEQAAQKYQNMQNEILEDISPELVGIDVYV
jgi:polysaccharide pyruvyl transferase WcaK-like protein